MKTPINPDLLPKCLKRFARKISEVSDERNNDDGYWVYPITGLIDPESGCHAIHETSPTACIERIKSLVPCSEDNCMDRCWERNETP